MRLLFKFLLKPMCLRHSRSNSCSCYSLALWAQNPESLVPFPEAPGDFSRCQLNSHFSKGLGCWSHKIGGSWKSGNWQANKSAFCFCISVLWNTPYLLQGEKKPQEYTAELSISTNHFSQRHTISNGVYLTNPLTPYRIKQITSSSPKRTKQAEYDFSPVVG